MLKMIKLLVVLGFVAIANASPLLRFEEKIVGGKPINITEVPYQISVFSGSRFVCGGSIISKNYILTAADCSKRGPYSVYAGSSSTNRGGTKHSVSAVIIHEQFGLTNDNLPINDIALMKVYPPFQLDETRVAVPLVKKGTFLAPGLHGTISGWGAIKENGSLSKQLQAVQIPLISKESCQRKYDKFGTIPEGTICAVYPQGGKDTCKGDFGGPLVVEGNLAGVVSWGYGCARSKYPRVFTEVAYYRDWIKENSGL